MLHNCLEFGLQNREKRFLKNKSKVKSSYILKVFHRFIDFDI